MTKQKSLYILNIFLFWMVAGALSCSGQSAPPFDEQSAFNYLVKQCDFGPRNPGSVGHENCKDYLIKELRKFAERVSEQPFQHTFGPNRQTATMTNIIANFNLSNSDRILLCAHWDTRPWADHDDNPEKSNTPIIGANDGASGVAVLLEIARIIRTNIPKYGVDIILFDAEDCGNEGETNSWAVGSQEFAKHKDPRYHPRYGILVDLIGDADLQIYQEQYSLNYAPDLVEKVWLKAEELGIIEFIPSPKYMVNDDHLPLLDVGIPCIDIIDFDYPYWHTTQDTPDKCSPESLGKVGRVVLSLLY